ncbi:hypothetical protein [Nocardiopsis composta]|uniref:Uncharacterized protein n=1 Tax=Nocardiopsis composta TaxID=157465 RepID=A0A7W8QKL3_9ACTN|nr:hypothetical protein [Nocardiopsis composta]MBB5431990.1 hypothetical protein [Nocardiopsis composta]
MRWVTYLSPSGGTERSGVIDDGCVFGHPGGVGLAELLDADPAGLAAAHTEALDAPLEIIVEFETRLCVPVRPDRPVPVAADGGRLHLAPELVHGTDDGAPLPPGASGLTASVGAAELHGASGRLLGRTAACLWRTPDGAPVRLSIGPAVVTPDEQGTGPLRVTAEADGAVLAAADLPADGSWAEPGERLSAAVPATTRPLEPGEELFVDAGPLGEFEIRVGAEA